MKLMKTYGYAYADKSGAIDMKTVSSTERAVMVNAIVILSAQQVVPLERWSDSKIRETFATIVINHPDGGQIVPVEVSVTEAHE